MSAHTPAPWSVRRIDSDGRLIYCLIGNPSSLSKLNGVAFAGTYVKRARKGLPAIEGARIAESEAEANARLIAAAPELLAALARITERFERVCPDADGKTDPIDIAHMKRANAAIAKATGATP